LTEDRSGEQIEDREGGATALLRVEDLSVDFTTPRGALRAADGVSFSLAEGETLGIVGESGSGKSVVLRSIMRLSTGSDVHRSGRITFDGEELLTASRSAVRRLRGREISIVFQDPMTSLNPVMRIGKQVAESVGRRDDAGSGRPGTTPVELLRLVGIPEPERRLRQYPHELSGGMRQRVAIAMALAASPRLLLADEPTTALDVTVQAQILDLLGSLQRDMQMALILVTHDLGIVATRADRIVVMYAGQVVEEAPTRKIFDETRMPYTEGLIRSIPRLDHPSGAQLHAIAGHPPDLSKPAPGCRFAPRCPYAKARCREQSPPLVAVGSPDHLARCWYPLGADPVAGEPSLATIATTAAAATTATSGPDGAA
jgi:oligopeptide/dipeptide ABC transporter ATP-binding protein